MKSTMSVFWRGAAVALICGASLGAAELAAATKAKVQAKIGTIQGWATDAAVVAEVKSYNAAPPAAAREMTQEKWKGLPVLDPGIRAYTRNPAAMALKTKKEVYVTEAFVSGADGGKVAFLNKPTNWSHKGKEKHAAPMAGSVWIGPVEVDESTGQEQVQVAVPVLDGGRPVGSLVVGIAIAKL
ncbi:MAG: hypothetical protein HY821_00575 [Acidobacteria bacterium]|nr:hypothetical protein [Acidobacteriota bacterium]